MQKILNCVFNYNRNKVQICIFEDKYFDRLEPLVLYRPVYDLFCGMRSIRDKILSAYNETKFALHCRSYLADFVKSKNPAIEVNKINDKACLLINGRILAPFNLADIIPLGGEDKLYKNGNTTIAARLSGRNLENIKRKINDPLDNSDFDNLPNEEIDIPVFNYVWDLISNNGKELISDFQFFIKQKRINSNNNLKGKILEGVHLVEKENIYIDEGVVIKPGAVIDASLGPVYIDKNTRIFPNAVIEGPVYIGENSQVKSCAIVYDNSTIAQTCKVGGEIENSIFLPFSNKQHAGFIGHSYIGSWVNIGADTNCSDLKNNYGNIKAYINGDEIDTKRQFLGLIMGDHSKTAINTMFNTGTTVGFSCNISGAGFPKKYIPSFSWGGYDSLTIYEIEKSINTAKKVLQRRNIEMNNSEENLFRKIFELTKNEQRGNYN